MAKTFHRSLSAALSILCVGAASGAPIRDGDLAGRALIESAGRQIEVVRVFGDHVFGNGFE